MHTMHDRKEGGKKKMNKRNGGKKRYTADWCIGN